MKFPEWLPVYGAKDYRGKCPKEALEQMTFFNRVRTRWPDTIGVLALHPKNEEKRAGRQFRTLEKDKAMGLCKGASDIIIVGNPSFVCELKRLDHTLCSWQDGQIEYLEAAQKQGSFVCVALGANAAIEAVEQWLNLAHN